MPAQSCRTTETRKIREDHLVAILDLDRPIAERAAGSLTRLLDMNHDRPTRAVVDTENRHFGQANKQRAHARRVGLQQGLSRSLGVENLLILRVPVPRPVDTQPSPRPRSNPKRLFSSTWDRPTRPTSAIVKDAYLDERLGRQ